MTNITDGEKFSGSNRLHGLSHQDSIHHNPIAGSKVGRGELMFRRDIRLQNVLPPGPFDIFRSLQVCQRNQDIVTGIELQYAGSHGRYRNKEYRMLGSVTVCGMTRNSDKCDHNPASGLQSPEAARIPTQHSLTSFRRVISKIILHDIQGSTVRTRHQAHWPVGADHQP